jgi:peptide/nickel transport system permease protein
LANYIIKRILTSFFLLIFISAIVFLLLELAPGDPATLLLGHDATKEGIAKLRAELGLDEPVYQRYFAFIIDAFHGDFGRSYETRRPVIEEVRNAFFATLQLAVASLLIAVLIGIPAGITSAVHQYSFIDKTIRFLILAAVSLPVFWLGLMLILLFSITLRWLPSFGRGGWENLVLPAFSLSCYSLAIIIRMTRSSMLEVLRNEYITTARAKGIPEFFVIYKHALRNALIPVVTIIGLQFGILLGGAVLTETVFAWPGVGRLLLQGIFSRDYPIIRAGVLLVSGCFVFINLLVDILYTYIDPTVVFDRKGIS